MRASTDLTTLTDFFDRYGTALIAGDLPTIASCYALPGLVVAGTYSFSFSSPAAVVLSFVGAAPGYADHRLIAANAQIQDVQRLSALLMMVGIEWEYLDSRGQRVPGECYQYVIRMTDTGPVICTVIRAA